jgi:hypothetical protein
MEALDGNRSDQQASSGFGLSSPGEESQPLTLVTAIGTGADISQSLDAENGVAGLGGARVGGAGEVSQLGP